MLVELLPIQEIERIGDEELLWGLCWLSTDKRYEVISIEDDYYRILDDNDDPVLFSPKIFRVTDSKEPSDWVESEDKEYGRSAIPAMLNLPYFFEDYHDDKQYALELFERFLKERGWKT